MRTTCKLPQQRSVILGSGDTHLLKLFVLSVRPRMGQACLSPLLVEKSRRNSIKLNSFLRVHFNSTSERHVVMRQDKTRQRGNTTPIHYHMDAANTRCWRTPITRPSVYMVHLSYLVSPVERRDVIFPNKALFLPYLRHCKGKAHKRMPPCRIDRSIDRSRYPSTREQKNKLIHTRNEKEERPEV